MHILWVHPSSGFRSRLYSWFTLMYVIFLCLFILFYFFIFDKLILFWWDAPCSIFTSCPVFLLPHLLLVIFLNSSSIYNLWFCSLYDLCLCNRICLWGSFLDTFGSYLFLSAVYFTLQFLLFSPLLCFISEIHTKNYWVNKLTVTFVLYLGSWLHNSIQLNLKNVENYYRENNNKKG